MTLREITVGRSKTSDIYLDPRCSYASNHHATIFYDGRKLMYKDNSTNGTMINNVSVHHRAIPINHGDIIMLAGQYQLSWTQIDAFFPPNETVNNYHKSTLADIASPVASPNVTTPAKPNLGRWNWGAFMLYPLWGFFHGCGWAFVIALLFGWTCIPSFIFGACGTRWAWENKSWNSVESFESSISTWNKVGLILFFLNLVLVVFYILFIIALVV